MAKNPTERALPCNIDAEKLVLGSILAKAGKNFISVAAQLKERELSLHAHQLIFRRMLDIHDRGQVIDRITITNELRKNGELESVNGFSYIVSLDDGMPDIPNIDAYVAIIKQKAQLRELIFIGESLTERAFIEDLAPEELAVAANAKLMDLRKEDKSRPESLARYIESFPGGYNVFMDPSNRPKGIPTGFTRLDDAIGGFQDGDLYFIAGRPGQGKTALVCNIIQHLGQIGIPSLLLSLEMSKRQLVTRMMVSKARVDNQKFKHGFLNQDERRRLAVALADLMEMPIYIDDTRNMDSVMIQNKIMQAHVEHRIKIVFIDHLGIVDRKEVKSSSDEVLAVGRITRAGKILAGTLGIPIVFLHQLSRESTKRSDPRPTQADLRGSGRIEEDADFIGFIHREETYKRDREDLRGFAEFIIGKNRDGPEGIIKLAFLKQFAKFENLAADQPEPPPQDEQAKQTDTPKSAPVKDWKMAQGESTVQDDGEEI